MNKVHAFTPVFLCALLTGICGCGSSSSASLDPIGEDKSYLYGVDDITGDLPVLSVTTADGKGITLKSKWKDASISVDGSDTVQVRVKGRGNSSWTFPKKPFNIDFGENVSFLDMPEGQRWCVLANWRDVTCIRNAVSLEIARLTSLDWTPQGRFVDLVMDGDYKGNFYVTEKIEVGENRVDVGLDGFLICMDTYYDETYRFKTSRRSLPVNIILPEDCALDSEGLSEIRRYLDSVEDALYKGKGDWRELIDVQSFCDWYIVHELTTNDEPDRPHSVYMHRKPGGKLIAGPAWDFDFNTFRAKKGLVCDEAVWFEKLLGSEYFCEELNRRWNALRGDFLEIIPECIDDISEQVAASARMNREMWPIYRRNNGDETLSFDAAVERLRANYLARIEALDSKFAKLL